MQRARLGILVLTGLALALTFLVSCVIVVAIANLVLAAGLSLFFNRLAPLDHTVFQDIFGMIMTLLIAMEFNHSILQTMERLHRIIQVKTVVLISILALARKFIILNIEATSATTISALGFAVIALGGVYWLMRERDDRSVAVRSGPVPAIKESDPD